MKEYVSGGRKRKCKQPRPRRPKGGGLAPVNDHGKMSNKVLENGIEEKCTKKLDSKIERCVDNNKRTAHPLF